MRCSKKVTFRVVGNIRVHPDSQLITAVEVLAGNSSDNVGALAMVERSEKGTGSVVVETIGDVVYGDGVTRQVFADAGRPLVAKLPRQPDGKRFPKEDFEIDLEFGTCTCPAGHTTGRVYRMGTRTDSTGRTHQLRAFRFDAGVCGACPLRERRLGSKKGSGRTVRLHPQEALLQQARELQSSESYAEYRRRRVVVEHRLARLIQLGMRQARYFEQAKTLFQLLMTATVANLTLVAGKVRMTREVTLGNHSRFSALSRVVMSATWWNDTHASRRGSLTPTTSGLSS